MGNMWHVRNWLNVGKKFSWKLSFCTLGGFLGLFPPFQNKFFFRIADKKHAFILDYLKRDLADVIAGYRNYEESAKETPHVIWTIWWQGEDNAPPLVNACYDSIRRHAGNAEFRVVTKDNLKDYLDVPDFIIQAKENGTLSMANFADVLRLMLLEKYGGLWLDSTIYLAGEIPEEAFDLPFYSLHTKWQYNSYVQHNLYHIFVIGGRPESKLISFTRAMFFEYLKKHDTMIDYFMLDYIFYIAYQEFPDIKAEIDSLPYSSERLYDLVHLLDKPFNQAAFDKLCSECIFSKLDWHRNYRGAAKGAKTYYSHIIGG